ncbi:MAG: DUF4436 domain-containing protein [Microthrixaceae bacterium]|nr:DUF4436 family protein [Microthrixaceae bacterium]MCO5313999.1 DUF4436 domain-containing protein [Microthrixaceae bacterium]
MTSVNPKSRTWVKGSPRRPNKTQIVALTVVSLLCLGPVVALIVAMNRPSNPLHLLSEETEIPNDGARVRVTVVSIAPTSGIARVQMSILPSIGLLDGSGLKDPLLLRVNDARGDNTVTFAEGEAVRAVDVSVDLSGNSVERYPFDEYEFGLFFRLELVVSNTEQSADGSVIVTGTTKTESVPITVELAAEVSDFNVDVNELDQDLAVPNEAVGVAYLVHRPLTTTVWAIGVMALMWGLAIVGVMIVWAILIWRIDLPFWAMGYFVGVLFALPPLRDSLPGSPPPGTLLDFVAFYWAVGITGITLITTVGVWLQRAKPEVVAPPAVKKLDAKSNKGSAGDGREDLTTKEHAAITDARPPEPRPDGGGV